MHLVRLLSGNQIWPKGILVGQVLLLDDYFFVQLDQKVVIPLGVPANCTDPSLSEYQKPRRQKSAMRAVACAEKVMFLLPDIGKIEPDKSNQLPNYGLSSPISNQLIERSVRYRRILVITLYFSVWIMALFEGRMTELHLITLHLYVLWL